MRRAAAAPLAAGLAAGLSGCGDSAGPEQGTTLEDLQAEGPVVDDADEDFRDFESAPYIDARNVDLLDAGG